MPTTTPRSSTSRARTWRRSSTPRSGAPSWPSWRDQKGWLGITWPKEHGGQDGEGVYEYLLNEQLAYRGGPQIGKGVGIIGKTLIRHGSEKLKKEFLPKILNAEVEFAVGYSEPQAGSDAANMQLKAERDEERGGWVLNGSEDLDHVGALCRVVLGRGAHRPEATSTGASRSSWCRWITRRPRDPAHAHDRRRDHELRVLQRRLRAG